MSKKNYLLLFFALFMQSEYFSQNKVYHELGEAELIKFNYDLSRDPSLTLGIKIKLNEGWHLYWINPGDAGIPTDISLISKDNLKIERITFPVPQYFENDGIVSFGFEGEFMILVKVNCLNVKNEIARFDLKLSGLVCKDICSPFDIVFPESINFSERYEASPDDNNRLEKFLSRLPITLNNNDNYFVIKDNKISFTAKIKDIDTKNIKTIFFIPATNGIINYSSGYNLLPSKTTIQFEGFLNPYLLNHPAILDGILKIELEEKDNLIEKSYFIRFNNRN